MKNILFILFALLSTSQLFAQGQSRWQQVDGGLAIAEFAAPQKSIVGSSKITIIKIDPHFYSFKLMTAKEYGVEPMTAKAWCQKYNLIAGVNAGMFQSDYRTNVGYMKNYKQVNNGKINAKYSSVFAFNPFRPETDSVKIFDIEADPVEKIVQKYHTVIQNLRLIKRPGKNRWSQQNREWSEVALGQDEDGNVLFLFSRSPYSMHDFNEIILKLPVHLLCAQHLEGGPEASLFFSYKGTEINQFGSYETGFNENNNNSNAWPIPNIIGIVKKKNE